MRSSSKLIVLILVIITALILLMINSHDNPETAQIKIENYKKELINADKDFYKESTLRGTGRAFIDFAADDVILMRQDQFPITGKNQLIKNYLNRDTVKTPLKWQPVLADVSPDGMLGYTFGNWEFTSKDNNGKLVTGCGNYVTVWKRQHDGSWKYVFDGGNTTPCPPVK